MFGGGLPGLLAGLGAFSFSGFIGSVCRVKGFLLPLQPMVCSVPF